jgi:hypothetical protein
MWEKCLRTFHIFLKVHRQLHHTDVLQRTTFYVKFLYARKLYIITGKKKKSLSVHASPAEIRTKHLKNTFRSVAA